MVVASVTDHTDLTVAVIGAGQIGQRHVRAFAGLGNGVRVVGVADIDEARAARSAAECGARAFADYQALLELSPDIAVICLPHHLHREAGEAAIVCGTFRLEHSGAEPLSSLLPGALFFSAANARFGAWLYATIHMIASEIESDAAGSDAIVNRLLETLFVCLLRIHCERLPEHSRGWLAATRDPQIGHALALIHNSPGEKWSARALARRVGLSRSSQSEVPSERMRYRPSGLKPPAENGQPPP